MSTKTALVVEKCIEIHLWRYKIILVHTFFAEIHTFWWILKFFKITGGSINFLFVRRPSVWPISKVGLITYFDLTELRWNGKWLASKFWIRNTSTPLPQFLDTPLKHLLIKYIGPHNNVETVIKIWKLYIYVII